MQSENKKVKVIECAGCGRTQILREKKIEPCDGYTCSYGSCNKNLNFKIPKPSKNTICELILNAAGGFSGWRIRLATEKDLKSIEAAKAILTEGSVWK